MANEPRELLILSEASRAIASLRTIDEAKDLRDKAEAVKAYARKARLGKEIFIEASIIKSRAERRLGEMLRETPLMKSVPGNQHTGPMEDSTQGDRCTLESLGLTKSDSSRLQKVASLPKDAFEQHIADMLAGNREVTTSSLLRLVKENQPQQKPTATPSNVAPSAKTACSLSDIVNRGEKYSTIYADPPWPYSNQATRAATSNHYHTMSIDEICAEPISQLVADKAHLHLWTTNAFLFEAIDVLEAWGFEYKSCFIWVKPQMGLGNYWRVSHEFMLLGVRGGLKFADRGQMSWLTAKRTKHSQKPEAVRQLIEQVSPPNYLEMYGRQLPLTPNWTVYGDQIG
jgi:N6-adenosine-specific RNA methylase IME4